MKNYKSIHEVICCEELSEIEKVQIEFHSDNFNGFETALKHYQDVEVYEGTALEYATEVFNERYDVSDEIERFIDYELFFNDLILRGDICQFNHKYLIINIDYI